MDITSSRVDVCLVRETVLSAPMPLPVQHVLPTFTSITHSVSPVRFAPTNPTAKRMGYVLL